MLTYHKVDRKPELGWTFVTPGTFRKQLQHLSEKGYFFVTLSELYTNYKNDEKAVAITFDDGYQNIYQYAFPILKEFNGKATVFIITSCIGGENQWDVNWGGIKFNHLNDDETFELIEHGWEIGSHGVSHTSFKSMHPIQMAFELKESKRILEERYHVDIKYFASPFGKSGRQIIDMVQQAGYKGVCGFYPFRMYNNKIPNGVVPRLAVYLPDGLKSIDRKLCKNKWLYWEVLKQNVINFCANGTLVMKAIK